MKTIPSFITVLAFAAAAHAGSPFVGTWKQNRAKTQFDANGGIVKIEAEGSGIRYSTAGMAVYGGPLDGSERPGLGSMARDTFKLTRNGDRGFEAVLHRNGKAVRRDVMEVSPDGKTLTSSFTFLAPRKDGKQPTNVLTFRRTSGDGKPYPFIGTWKQDLTLTKWGEDTVPMTIAESNGVLTMSSPVSDTRTVVDLNRSPVTVTGESNPMTDMARTAKRIDERSFETSATRGGRTTTILYRVSADGRTMTSRYTWQGDDGKPVTTTWFYERQ